VDLADNLLTAPVLAFIIAALATFIGSDIKLPDGLYSILPTYLLLAIGIKGGKGLSATTLGEVGAPLLASVVLGIVTPVIAYLALRRLGRLDVIDSSAVAAHYGSVSAVTFTVVLAYVERKGAPAEGYLAGLLALLEVIGIIVALAFAQRSTGSGSWNEAVLEVVKGRSIVLLLAGLFIGLAAGPERLKPVDPLFVGLFQGALTLFLLEMPPGGAVDWVATVGARDRYSARQRRMWRRRRFARRAVDVGHRGARHTRCQRVLHCRAGRSSHRPAVGSSRAIHHSVARNHLPVQCDHRYPDLLRNGGGLDVTTLVERQLVTIIAESVLQHRLLDDLRRLGAKGWSMDHAEGRGSRGLHATDWDGPNVRIESVVSEPVAEAILNHLVEQYFEHYAVVAFTTTVRVARPEKY
jgi:Na+-dependent bicarbonate transporter superfamily